MFKLIALFSALLAVTSAGYIGGYGLSQGIGLGHGYGLGYGGYAPALHASSIAYSAPVIKTYAAPTIVKSYAAPVLAAPLIKTIAHPVATSYANTYKVATKSIPVIHAAPALAVHAAPTLVHQTSSTYHGNYGLGYSGYGHGLSYGIGSSLYH